MRSLLERQIRKYLTDKEKNPRDISDLLDAVGRSYDNYDTQLKMIRRAMMISSEELFEANRKLTAQAENQSKLIDKLKDVINTLSLSTLPKTESLDKVELDGEKLAKFIDDQAKQIVETSNQKEELLKNLEKQNQELNEYAHIVSHDLKSPLRSIDALTNWLKEDYADSFDENGKDTLNHILKNVEKMDSLISGILEYSTIDKAETKEYDVDVHHLVNEIIGIIYIPEHIKININETLPTIKGDKFRLQQLFQNLLINAVNYIDKPKGLVEVGVKESKDFWNFYIKDNGIGISEAYHEKIFEVFQKLTDNDKSTGIGLAIVKKIINYYGGSICLASKVNEGTTFYFTIPKR